MQFVLLVEQVSIHCCAANRAAVFAQQHQRLGLTFVICGDFITRHQIDRRLAALFRRQAVARTAQKHTRGRRANLHGTTAFLARNIGHDRLVGAHSALRCRGDF